LGKGKNNTHRRPASQEPTVRVACTPCTPFDHFKLKITRTKRMKTD